MLWIEKIKLRRKVLLDEDDDSGDKVVVPSLEIEDSKDSLKFDMGDIPESSQSEAFEKALLELVIPRAVYRNAIKGILESRNNIKRFRKI